MQSRNSSSSTLNNSPQQFYLAMGKNVPNTKFKQYDMHLKKSKHGEETIPEKNEYTASFRKQADSFGPLPD